MSIGEGCTRHQQNVATWIIDCRSAVGGLAISFNCWYCIFGQCWSYDKFFACFSAIKQFSWQFEKFFHKINTPLYRYTYARTCIDMHIRTHAHTHKLAHAQRHACISYSGSGRGDFLPHNYEALLVLTEYPRILLLQTVLVCEEVFSNIFL